MTQVVDDKGQVTWMTRVVDDPRQVTWMTPVMTLQVTWMTQVRTPQVTWMTQVINHVDDSGYDLPWVISFMTQAAEIQVSRLFILEFALFDPQRIFDEKETLRASRRCAISP